MSDRAAEMGHEGATVCPFVAFQDDRERRATDPDHRHRCYAEPLPAPRAIAHQRRYCLSPEFPSCPIFQDWAVRAAATGVSMPSARRISGPPPPIAPAASATNGSTKRTPDWAAPPPWVAAAGDAPADPSAPPRGQMSAFEDGLDGDDVMDAPAAAALAAADPTGTAKPIRSTPVAESPRAPEPRARRPTGPAATARNEASGGDLEGAGERPRTGRGFAYDLIADDPSFAGPPEPDEPDGIEDADDDGQPAWAARPGSAMPPPPSADVTAQASGRAGFDGTPAAGEGYGYADHAAPPARGSSDPRPPVANSYAPPAAASPYAPPAAATPYGPPPAGSPYAPPAAAETSARGHGQLSGSPARAGRTTPPPGLPEPDYLPPVKQMATPAGRSGRPGPFEGERDWEKPRRFEAYPTLRTRVGMPGVPRIGRLPPVAIGLLALLLAAGVLFALPGFFASRLGDGETSPRPSSSARPSVSAAPTTVAPPTPQVYIVRSGDTFIGIARRFGLTVEELQAANPQIENIARLRVGDRINIPDAFSSPTVGPSDEAGETPSPTAEP